MNIYIDESGSINNKLSTNFIIALVIPKDSKELKKSYKRFVSKYLDRLKELDSERINRNTGKVIRPGGKMFHDGKFQELKGAQFDRDMKLKFIEFFSEKPNFEVFYITIDNKKLTDTFCTNTARVFNYTLKLAIEYFIKHKYIEKEDCKLQLDERNERTETRYFLENYLNTELTLSGITDKSFTVEYFDSSNNKLVQMADVFANILFSEKKTKAYTKELQMLEEKGIIRFEFVFPK